MHRCEGRSVQLLHISEREYTVTTDCEDAKGGQFSFYTFQRVCIKHDRLRRCKVSSASTHFRREYKVLTDCEDAKVGQFSFYIFQRVSIKC